jgi:hypothetical protein
MDCQRTADLPCKAVDLTDIQMRAARPQQANSSHDTLLVARYGAFGERMNLDASGAAHLAHRLTQSTSNFLNWK